MRLLIITQKVDKNDPDLEFFHRWLEEFSKRVEQVIVISLMKGKYNLPENVEVLSLGKEDGKGKIEYLRRFYFYIWTRRRGYDAVFVHMNPEYIIFGGLLWHFLGKHISLWYVHRQSNLKLKIAEKFSDIIFTSAKESFTIKSSKVVYVGHGVDADRFIYVPRDILKPFSMLYVGRITRIKNIDVIFRGLRNLLDAGVAVRSLVLAGEVVTSDDRMYEKELLELISRLDIENYIDWRGPVKNHEMLNVYADATVTVNASPDGGMDKVVLEALFVGRPTFFSNKAFRGVYGEYAELFNFKESDSLSLAEKITGYLKYSEQKENIVKKLSVRARGEYSVEKIIDKITTKLN
jgi:glycosyltransferase involved in cell wall biosynthesis